MQGIQVRGSDASGWSRGLLLSLLGCLLVACVGPGLLTDGTTVSVGNHATGALRGGRRLPFRGDGYVIPKRWQDRQRNYGSDELVELLVRSARRVHQLQPGAVVGIADLSPRGGGATPEHRSHRSGRDVDLIYFMKDLQGRPVTPTEMVSFDAEGLGTPPPIGPVVLPSQPEQKQLPSSAPATPTLKLDVPRTWAMVRALITDPQVSVQWIFIGRPITDLLLQHARRQKEPDYIVERAIAVMHQPSDAQDHMDHWHVRIFCPPSDRFQGCLDRGPARWLKKDIKYLDSPEPIASPLQINLSGLSLRPVRLADL